VTNSRDSRLQPSEPLLTSALPGTGGVIRHPEDFIVEELPAYLPQGEGEHVFAWIEKRLLTTPKAVEILARHVGASSRDCGYAGMKDKHAVTRQWISLPVGTDERALARFDFIPQDESLGEQLRVLEVRRHKNKLRTGHLRGNRFCVRLRELDVDENEGEKRASHAICVLERGMPNYFGAQRFGARGNNAQFAREILAGSARPPRDKRRRRLIASALQSELFNALLAKRLSEGRLFTMFDGDVLQKRDSGGLFVSEARSVDQKRLDERKVTTTGPLWGPRTPLARGGSEAEIFEAGLLERSGLSVADFERFGRDARGGRRPLFVIPARLAVLRADGGLELQFELSAGSYATTLIREVSKEYRDLRTRVEADAS
jgi:tRNA pseudouridine13 synthase